LRQELEGKHRREQPATADAQHAGAHAESAEQAESAEWVSKATA
jgi:hypothetical protein